MTKRKARVLYLVMSSSGRFYTNIFTSLMGAKEFGTADNERIVKFVEQLPQPRKRKQKRGKK